MPIKSSCENCDALAEELEFLKRDYADAFPCLSPHDWIDIATAIALFSARCATAERDAAIARAERAEKELAGVKRNFSDAWIDAVKGHNRERDEHLATMAENERLRARLAAQAKVVEAALARHRASTAKEWNDAEGALMLALEEYADGPPADEGGGK